MAGVLAGAALAAAGAQRADRADRDRAGTDVRVGGPPNTPNVPLPGTISFRVQDGSTISLSSDGSGKFSGQLPVGTYAVTAASSLINDGKFRVIRAADRARARRSHRDPDPHRDIR